ETGQALFKIDDALRSIEHEQAQAAADRAESEYELAAANWRRIESLPDQTSSSMERIRAQMQYRAAKADKQRADALVRESALLLERTTTRSPIDGVVSGIHFRQGEFAQPGQPLLEVIEVDRFKLVAEIEDRDVIWVEAGFPVALSTDALPGERFVGKVGRVYPKSLATSHKFEVEIEVPDPDHRLRPGFFMQGTITHRTHGGAGADSSSVLVVPREAVIRRYGQHLCYVVRSTEEQSGSGQVLRAVRTPVEVLPIPADPRRYELVRGVAEGDRVVTKGIGHLSDETVVRITD
ncbi:MAG: efflux RND transporter periplasmic adaptor subunit, partial [Phycisphaerae bacterium]